MRSSAAQRLEDGPLDGRPPGRLGVARHRAQHPDAAWVDLRGTQCPMRADGARPPEPLQPGGPPTTWRGAHQAGIGDQAVRIGRLHEAGGQIGPVADLPPAVEPRLEARRQHRRQSRADRRAIVGGDLLGQDEQIGRQHRGRDDCFDRLELAGLRPVLRVGLAIEHVAQRQPAAVGNQQERAGSGHLPLGGNEVAESAFRTVGQCVDGHAHRATGQGHSRAAFRSVGDAVARGVPLPG